jgi:hypothetical protein
MTPISLISKRELGIKTMETTSTGVNHLTFNILFLSSETALITGILFSSFVSLRREKAIGF